MPADTETTDLNALADELCAAHPTTDRLMLAIGGCKVLLETNAPALKALLVDYFRGVVVEPTTPDFRLIALEGPERDFGVPLTPWPREAGKRGQKESYADLPAGRLIRKVRTGMQFLLLDGRVVAFGPCLKNPNQIINLVNSQYLSWLTRKGYLVCHAAGIIDGGRGLGLAGISGAGKSTLALTLLSQGVKYVSNDRLLVGREIPSTGTQTPDRLRMEGVPKMPRINPGTILGNPDLWPILPEQRLAEVRAMPRDELWELEEKYDADVDRLFGEGTTVHGGPLDAFVVLTWSHRDSGPMRPWCGKLKERPELCDAIVKHPGIFHTVPGEPGAARAPSGPPARGPYLEMMGELTAIELSGGVDFAAGAAYCRRVLEQGS